MIFVIAYQSEFIHESDDQNLSPIYGGLASTCTSDVIQSRTRRTDDDYIFKLVACSAPLELHLISWMSSCYQRDRRRDLNSFRCVYFFNERTQQHQHSHRKAVDIARIIRRSKGCYSILQTRVSRSWFALTSQSFLILRRARNVPLPSTCDAFALIAAPSSNVVAETSR